jgi:hypothetical protein
MRILAGMLLVLIPPLIAVRRFMPGKRPGAAMKAATLLLLGAILGRLLADYLGFGGFSEFGLHGMLLTAAGALLVWLVVGSLIQSGD